VALQRGRVGTHGGGGTQVDNTIWHGTAAEWAADNRVLGRAVAGIETDTGVEKIGDGVTTWSALPLRQGDSFAAAGLGGNLLGLRTARLALAARHYAPMKTVFFGDSLLEGQGATTRAGRGIEWFAKLMRQRYPSNGVTTGGPGYLAAFSATFGPDSPWETYTSSTGTVAEQGGIQSLGYRTSLMSAAATKTWTAVGTSCDIYWSRTTPGGGFTVSIDGGAESGTVSTAGTFSTAMRTQGISLGASGSHTIRVTATSNNTYINGVFVYDGDETSGIHIYDSSRSQTTSAAVISGGVVSPSWLELLNVVAPHLIVCELSTNDWLSDTAPATVKANLQLYVNAFKALTAPPSVVLLAVPEAADVKANPWSAYVQNMRDIAAAEASVTLLDMTQLVPKADTSGTGWHASDGLHPNNNRGHPHLADTLLRFLDG
jgi:lysophospholipase L1-like esterase